MGNQACDDCERGYTQVELASLYQSVSAPADGTRPKEAILDITLDDGRLVGSIIVPPALLGGVDPAVSQVMLGAQTVLLDSAARRVNGNRRIGSVVSDITLSSPAGLITRLSEPMKICFQPSADEDNSERCLGYYDEDAMKWKCEDRCLSKEEDGSYCGTTGHLTSFALLLGAGAEDCNSDLNSVLAWISLGFVLGALCLIALAVVVIEVYVRVQQRRQKIFLRKLASTTHTI